MPFPAQWSVTVTSVIRSWKNAMFAKLVEDVNNALGRNEVHLLSEVGSHSPQNSGPQLVLFLLRVAWLQAPLAHAIENPRNSSHIRDWKNNAIIADKSSFYNLHFKRDPHRNTSKHIWDWDDRMMYTLDHWVILSQVESRSQAISNSVQISAFFIISLSIR